MTNNTTDILRAIENEASWISHRTGDIAIHARRLEQHICKLRERPDWATKAEDELLISAEKMHTALCTIKSVLDLYKLKPVAMPAYEQQLAAE